MADHDLARNKELACQFMDNIVRRDLAAMDRLLHKDFVWNVAVTPDDAPNELRPMQSKLLAGKSLWHKTPRMDRAHSMQLFKHLFSGASVGDDAAGGEIPQFDEAYAFRFKVHGLTAEEDRVAMEAESWQPNPNGRLYNQLYHYLFRVKDDQIVLYKEYQDTLHLFDYMAK
jgi:ketosteroid isomerase-like protein